ncbi:TPA: HIT family protein [Candidatus Uhrbacteria bacterium]|nr:HIT family protein [Candidatus Uhrbacteria bacterium]
MQDCIFCKIVRGELPSFKVFEDEHVLAFMDIEPVAVGHVLVIPKEHAMNLYDASEESIAQAFSAAHRIGPRVANAVGAEGFHITMNNGEAAWQTVFHPHIHILPRYPGDNHDPWKKHQRSREELARDAKKIQTLLG